MTGEKNPIFVINIPEDIEVVPITKKGQFIQVLNVRSYQLWFRSRGERRKFILMMAAETLGISDPFSFPEALLGDKNLLKIFGEQILELANRTKEDTK